MSKISELSDGGSLLASDYLLVVRSGGNVKVRMDQINVDQVDLGDNEFIRLGNSQDLTMVHNASNSIINQAGIGDLLLQKAGATKLTINATGIDVTGSVTADGLTVDGNASTTGVLTLGNAGIANAFINSADSLYINIDSNNDQAGGNDLQIGRNSTGASSEKIFLAGENGDISFYEDTGTTPKFFWDASAESLGIGTSTPSAPLTIGYSGAEAQLQINNSGDSRMVYLGAFSDNEGILRLFNSSNVETVRIAAESTASVPTYFNAGNVGIGTSSPSALLDVEAASPVIELRATTTTATTLGAKNNRILLTSNSTTAGAGGEIVFNTTDSTTGRWAAISGHITENASGAAIGDIVFATKATSAATTLTEAMRIVSSGNLLVGNPSLVAPNFKIQGPNAATAGMNIGFVSMGNSNGGYPYIGYNCAPTATNLTRYKYVNDYASWIDFHQGQVRTFTTTTGGTGNTSGTAGPYVAGGGTSWTSSSDRRLKDDVQAISYGLDAVKALEPVSYVRNDRDIESRELGFIAQDVEGVVDEVVNITDDGYYGLDYQRLIPVLTKAIQEQQATIEALTARIEALES